ncbi:MAG TPA: hypothetical protein VLD67_13085 [Vicinamibacterales bacterium]|nr:hypothetical protein [Vicinamibacterales bacterium]
MTHLRDDEFVDCLDGRLATARAAHLESCPDCRATVDRMREVLEVALTELPEPSPLFWDHLSRRVRDGVAREQSVPSTPSLIWSHRWLSACVMAAVLAAGVALVVWRPGGVAPAIEPAHVTEATDRSDSTGLPDFLDDIDADEAWAFVRMAAEDVAREDASESGIAVQPGAAERAILRLSEAERQELARLIEEAIRTGA